MTMNRKVRPLISGPTIGIYPNPKAYDLHKSAWGKEVQAKLDEMRSLTEQMNEHATRASELRREVEEAKEGRANTRARFLRGLGEPGPTEEDIAALERQQRTAQDEADALYIAARSVEAEVHNLVSEGAPPDVLDRIRKAGRQHAEAAAELQAKLDAETREHDIAAALFFWAQGHRIDSFRPTRPDYLNPAWYEEGAQRETEPAPEQTRHGMVTSYSGIS
jgi:hypothetical protein